MPFSLIIITITTNATDRHHRLVLRYLPDHILNSAEHDLSNTRHISG